MAILRPALAVVPHWHGRDRLVKMCGGVFVAQLRQRDITLARLHLRHIEGMPILGFLHLLLQLAGFAEGRGLQLLGPFEQRIRVRELAFACAASSAACASSGSSAAS